MYYFIDIDCSAAFSHCTFSSRFVLGYVLTAVTQYLIIFLCSLASATALRRFIVGMHLSFKWSMFGECYDASPFFYVCILIETSRVTSHLGAERRCWTSMANCALRAVKLVNTWVGINIFEIRENLIFPSPQMKQKENVIYVPIFFSWAIKNCFHSTMISFFINSEKSKWKSLFHAALWALFIYIQLSRCVSRRTVKEESSREQGASREKKENAEINNLLM